MNSLNKHKSIYIKVIYSFPFILFTILWYTQSAYGINEKQQVTTPASEPADISKQTEPAEEKIKSEGIYVYNSTGKTDPFRSLILGKKEKIKQEEERRKTEVAKEEEKFKKELEKIPVTPLQQFELASMKVVAIIWGEIGKYAMVEAPDGKGYTIKKGTYIGKSRGIVKDVTADTIIVEEKYQDVDKKVKTRDVELKLKKEE
ncbi:MAG: pilus assembly protein PilP [Nitrospinae bacterium]|nr:pilus assembly protein PilP [Nitrospinota bacterium]